MWSEQKTKDEIAISEEAIKRLERARNDKEICKTVSDAISIIHVVEEHQHRIKTLKEVLEG